MDPQRFDDFVRTLAVSRRSVLRSLWAGAAAAFAGAVSVHRVNAKPKPFQRVNKPCGKGQPCGELTVCEFGVCRPLACQIDGVIYERNQVNPSDPCQRCNPSRSWNSWSTADDGTGCPLPPKQGECESDFIATCEAGVCKRQLISGTPCGSQGSQVCCNGTCCESGQVCDNGHCEDDDPPRDPPGGCEDGDCPSTCTINGRTYAEGEADREFPCYICDPSKSTTDWTPRGDNVPCSPPGEEPVLVCCGGHCCQSDFCCGGKTCCFQDEECCGEICCMGECCADGVTCCA